MSAVLVLGASACTGDDDDAPSGEEASPEASAAPLATRVSVGQVAGELSPQRRAQAKQAVADVVDGWIDAAYVGGEWPREGFAAYTDALRDFTPDARRRAARDRGLLTNVAIGDRVESVRASRRVLQIDVLGAGGKPVGATARIGLRFRTDGEVRRVDVVSGRLMLTPTKKGWKVFGYDVSRSTIAPGKAGKGKAGKQGEQGRTGERR
ncbi:hypothetical protein [Nocardioides sp. zg-DK7169]|uniref:hypothetical protein n=1 Tax=Nocardioides sp. zg-DK7169 TaxID=2736600 RepID=UPI00155199D4|nr:hypothetical protein [Nocardioides sp. zg-DK7169]NPC96144.1 hypothetical protein [Nocardioides sp. zg-DK7169]